MAVVKGTNAGFVTVAPSSDPSGAGTTVPTNYNYANKDTAPVGAVKVTEIGWWADNATENQNFEVGIYDHDAVNNRPGNLLAGVSRTNAKGTTAGWKKATGLNISITAGTVYWIAVQLDDGESTLTDYGTPAGERFANKQSTSTLPDPWDTGLEYDGYYISIYAVWEAAAAGTNMQINIADTWKDVASAQINIGDTWKDVVTGTQINIGDTWKTIF